MVSDTKVRQNLLGFKLFSQQNKPTAILYYTYLFCCLFFMPMLMAEEAGGNCFNFTMAKQTIAKTNKCPNFEPENAIQNELEKKCPNFLATVKIELTPFLTALKPKWTELNSQESLTAAEILDNFKKSKEFTDAIQFILKADKCPNFLAENAIIDELGYKCPDFLKAIQFILKADKCPNFEPAIQFILKADKCPNFLAEEEIKKEIKIQCVALNDTVKINELTTFLTALKPKWTELNSEESLTAADVLNKFKKTKEFTDAIKEIQKADKCPSFKIENAIQNELEKKCPNFLAAVKINDEINGKCFDLPEEADNSNLFIIAASCVGVVLIVVLAIFIAYVVIKRNRE